MIVGLGVTADVAAQRSKKTEGTQRTRGPVSVSGERQRGQDAGTRETVDGKRGRTSGAGSTRTGRATSGRRENTRVERTEDVYRTERNRTDDRRDRDDDWDDRRDRDDDDWDDDDRYDRKREGKGPAFCRSGAGHPVHGRQWCIDKGFGLGGDRYDDRYDPYDDRHDDRRYDPVWEDRSWEDVIFRSPRRYEDRRTLEQGVLDDLLGRSVMSRIQQQRRLLGVGDPIVGRWSDANRNGSRVLQLRAGQMPLAELADWNGDGRVDAVLLNRGR